MRRMVEDRSPDREFVRTHRDPGGEFMGSMSVGLRDGLYPLVSMVWRSIGRMIRWARAEAFGRAASTTETRRARDR